ncbi:O-fucosyltransferase 36-like [Wolffia australiana]
MERAAATSSDEDDGEALMPQNERKHRRSFEISDHHDHRARFDIRSRWPYLLAFFSFFLLLFLLFFSFKTFQKSPSISNSFSEADRMRENELHALSLLRNQQINLLRLWNKTSADELRSALKEQIKLNQQIQKSLLSSHDLDFFSGNDSYSPIDGGFEDVCRRSEAASSRRTIEWRPKKNRFLLAICVSGQMSNHLICLQKHMFFAAILDRALILPSPKLDYQYDRVVDVEHINRCFGGKVVVPFDQFAESKKNSKIQINRLICYAASPPCFLDDEHIKRLKNLGIAMGKIEAAWPGEKKRRTADEVRGKFACDDEVLAVGDLFYADVEEEWVMQPGGPLAHNCRAVIEPNKLILLTAQRFVQTFLGSNYVALHFRRHGFLQFCNAKAESCFFPVPQAAQCILRVAEKANAPVIYLSTDAAGSETDLLQSLVHSDGRPIPLIKRPGHNSVEKWDALLYRNHLGDDTQVEAMLDKTICAMARVFIGSSGSTFTDDIFRLRKDWGYASVCDENLCQGEQPNFIASKA